MNLIANVKTLTEVCHLIQDEEMLESTNKDVQSLLKTVNQHLSEVNKGLYVTPKPEQKKKRKNENNKNEKLQVQKHPYSGRVGRKAEMMRQFYKVKLTLSDMEGFPEPQPKKTKRNETISVSDGTEKVEFIKATKVTEKHRVHAKINDIIRAELTSANAYLSDLTINLAQLILHKQFPHFKGFEDTEYSLNTSATKFSPMVKNFIQIIHIENHWVTVASREENEVSYFDSLFSGYIKDLVLRNIATMSQSQEPNLRIKVAECQQQGNSVDCGLFAVAFATDLAADTDPTLKNFDASLMRSHLLNCLEANEMKPFPVTKKRYKKCKPSLITQDVYCFCRDIYIESDVAKSGNFMANCSSCDEWYHRKCVKNGIPIKVFKSEMEAEKWLCPKCI